MKTTLKYTYTLAVLTSTLLATTNGTESASPIVVPTCNTFADGLQTRGNDSTVDFSKGSAKLYNNPDSTLNTYHTPVNGGAGNDLTCVDNISGERNQSCKPSDVGAATIAPITVLHPAVFTLATPVTDATNDVKVNSETPPLTLSAYNKVTSEWDKNNILHANFDTNSNQLKVNYLKLKTKEGKVTFSSSSLYDITIGEFVLYHTTVTNGFNTKNIKIGTLGVAGTTNRLSLSASQTIKINQLTTKDSSDYNLTAPYVNINTLKDVSGSGKENSITIKANSIDIGTLDIGDATTLNIVPLTPGKNVIVKINSLKTGSKDILNFAKGTYYIKTLNTSGSGNGYKWNMNGKVNLILEDDWNTDSAIAINADTTGGDNLENDSHNANNLFIYSKGNITTSNNTRIVGTIYSEKDITLNSASYIKGALSAKDKITLGNRTKVYYDTTIESSGLGECGGSASTTYLTGLFDAWDVSRDDMLTPPSDRNISTKIVNKAFKLSLASLNNANNMYQPKVGEGIVDVTVSIYPKKSSTPISNSVTFYPSVPHLHESADINVTSASKDAFVGFKFCATYEKLSTTTTTTTTTTSTSVSSNPQYHFYNSSKCTDKTVYDCNTTTTNNKPTWHLCYSTDDLAIRPYSFVTFGKNQYKRAGEDFNITIKAVDETNANKVGNSDSAGDSKSTVSSTSAYDANITDLMINSHFYQPTATEITQMQTDIGKEHNASIDGQVSNCPNAGLFTLNNSNLFNNGEVNASLKFTETGILDLNISEKPGSEWAKVDEDDTNDTQRYIKPSLVTYNESDINASILQLFVPYKFDTTVESNTTTTKNWLYMYSTNTASRAHQMSTFVKYRITALNKDGAVVQNYTRKCFPDTNEEHAPRVNGLKLNTTFDLFLDMDLNTTKDANISLFTENNTSQAVWEVNPTKSLQAGVTTPVREWISPFQFENGRGEAIVYFNIDRNVSKALNPIQITLVDANTSTSWMANAGSPKEFNGTIVNQNVTFLYAMAHAQRQRYSASEGDAPIYYEVYCNSGDKSLLPDGQNSKYNDDPRWFINTHHQVATEGKIIGVKQKVNSYVTTTSISTATPTIVHLKYDENQGYPYTTTMEINASNWLIYNKYNQNATENGFQVEFINSSQKWAGKHETNSSTKRTAAEKTNRRLMW